MSANITSINDANFEEEVLKSDIPVIVDFWAEWCGPCRMLAPNLEAIAATYAGKIKIVKVNVDENTKTPATYNVRGIPTLVMFKKGEAVATKVGAMTKTQLTDFIEDHL